MRQIYFFEGQKLLKLKANTCPTKISRWGEYVVNNGGKYPLILKLVNISFHLDT